ERSRGPSLAVHLPWCTTDPGPMRITVNLRETMSPLAAGGGGRGGTPYLSVALCRVEGDVLPCGKRWSYVSRCAQAWKDTALTRSSPCSLELEPYDRRGNAQSQGEKPHLCLTSGIAWISAPPSGWPRHGSRRAQARANRRSGVSDRRSFDGGAGSS